MDTLLVPMFGTGSEADVTEAGGTVPSTVVGIVAIFGTSFADNFGRSWRAGERWPQVPRQRPSTMWVLI